MPSYKLNTLTERQRDILIAALKDYEQDTSDQIDSLENGGELKVMHISYYGSEKALHEQIQALKDEMEDINYLLSQLETPIGA